MATGTVPNGRRLVQTRFRLDGLIRPALDQVLRACAKGDYIAKRVSAASASCWDARRSMV